MDDRIIAALRSKDANMRRKGILAAGKSGDAVYIKALNHIIYTDDAADLRELAQKASQHIRTQESASTAGGGATATAGRPAAPRPVTPAPRSEPAQKSTTNTAAQSAKPVQSRNPRYSARKMIPFLLFILVIAGVGGYVVWAKYGDVLRYMYWKTDDSSEQLEASLQLPQDGSTLQARLEGKLYHLWTSDVMRFFIQEPHGQTPEGGWPIVMCLGGGSTPRAFTCYNWMQKRASHEKVIFVSPDLYDTSTDDAFIANVRTLVDEIGWYYSINWDRSVVYGFSNGGRLASYYAANYPLDFAGVVMGDPAGFTLPYDGDSPVLYGLVSGDAMGYERELYGFVAGMEQRGTPVWRSQILPGMGHDVTIQHIDMVFDLLWELSRPS